MMSVKKFGTKFLYNQAVHWLMKYLRTKMSSDNDDPLIVFH